MAETVVLSHWYQLVDGLDHTSEKFYSALEAELESWELERARVSRVHHAEGAVFGSKRLYLRVQQGEYIFDVCAAAFGRGFFVSWWLVTQPGGCLLALPVIGWIMRKFIVRDTYYRIDRQLMLRDVVHAGVLHVLDGLMEEQELTTLTADQRKPIMRDLLSA